jgi:hypothetical protein
MKIPANTIHFNPVLKTASSTDEVGQAQARGQLLGMAVTLTSGGSAKSGFLRLRAGDKTGPDLSNGRWGSGSTAAASLVKDLVHKAYGADSPIAKNFDAYLQKREKVGVKSFLKLVKAMERDSLPPDSDLNKMSLPHMGGRLRLWRGGKHIAPMPALVPPKPDLMPRPLSRSLDGALAGSARLSTAISHQLELPQQAHPVMAGAQPPAAQPLPQDQPQLDLQAPPVPIQPPRSSPPPAPVLVAAHQPHLEGHLLNKGVVDLEGLPPSAAAGLRQNQGIVTPELVQWLVSSGQLRPALDPETQNIQIELLPKSGASTMALMMVKDDGQNTFLVKECGQMLELDGLAQYAGYYQDVDSRAWISYAFEDQKLEYVGESPIGRMGTIDTPNGARFGLAHTEATLRYLPELDAHVLDRGVALLGNQKVMHQLNVLRLAPGRPIADVLEASADNPALALQAAADMGSALGAFHRQTADPSLVEPTGGLKVLIHGDFHPGNLFYDPDSRTLTAIDLAGAAGNFLDLNEESVEFAVARPLKAPVYTDRVPPGRDMLMDLKRAMEQGSHFKEGPPELQQAFLQAYAENFKDLLDASGQPRYSLQRLLTLAEQPILGQALT